MDTTDGRLNLESAGGERLSWRDRKSAFGACRDGSNARVLTLLAPTSCLYNRTGVGLGSDVAVAGDGFAGSGLWLGESMAHPAVFGGI
jgi:hypothetical protein